MMPGDGIGPEMMGYVKEVFSLVGAPVDFEEIKMDPNTGMATESFSPCLLIFPPFGGRMKRYPRHNIRLFPT